MRGSEIVKYIDVLVIGGGSAGMSAAISAREQGIDNVLILERASYLGGVLRQCIHNGFGVHKFKEDLTGTEYAKKYVDKILEMHIPYLTDTFVLNVSKSLTATAMNSTDGLFDIQAKAIVLAMGCRERPRGALLIPGSRPAGIFNAGTAQKYLNIEGYLPGKKVVILGSGDIGLIMARQFTLEGAKVEEVVEIMPYSSGLARNISQCLNDFNIPISYNSTVIDIRGKKRVETVTVANVDKNRKPIPGTERDIACDTLLISAGLIPENELSKEAGIVISDATKGAVVDDFLQTSIPGVFACGNVLHVHDMVDYVSAEGEFAGKNAALFAQDKLLPFSHADSVPIADGEGINGTVPQYIRRDHEEKQIRLMFRPKKIYKNCYVCVDVDDQCVLRKKCMVLAPGEMCEISINRDMLKNLTTGVNRSGGGVRHGKKFCMH